MLFSFVFHSLMEPSIFTSFIMFTVYFYLVITIGFSKDECFVLILLDISSYKLALQAGWESYVGIAERKAISFCWRFPQ